MQGSEPSEPLARLNPRLVLATIVGFWLFYWMLVTLRAWVVDFPAQEEMAVRRAIVSIVAMGITGALWLVLRPIDHKPVWVRMATVALAAIPCAAAIATVNYYAFYIYDPEFMGLMEAGLADRENFQVAQKELWVEIFETALSRYYFLLAWAAVYIALGYSADVRNAERKAARFARAAQHAELRALRYQINPHFLFNAFNSLSALVMSGRKAEAEAMILNLSSFYRTALSGNSSGDVPLGEEVDVQRLYLDVEATRFAERLKVEIDLPQSLASYPVPGLILQPLVENAIKHGVALATEAITIRIAAETEGDGVLVHVINDVPSGQNRSAGDGVGIANVRERLAARYGEAATLTAGLSGTGWRATISLPGPAAEREGADNA